MSSTSAVTAWTGPVRSAPTSAETMGSEAGGRASSVDEHDAAVVALLVVGVSALAFRSRR